jgi:ubiquinone/menaquinone biosynthesis C-methylase UbiE
MLVTQLEKSRITDIYRRIAPSYDLWAWLTESKARDRCLELAAIQNGEAVLEVAVGTGLAFEKILKLNPSGLNEGIDLTDAMLSRADRRAAKSGLHNYRLRIGDAYDLDFPDDSFDVLVNNYMFDLLPERDFATVLDEFKRVLRPGGRLAMVNMTKGERCYNGIWERIYRINPALLGGCRGVELLPKLESCGFEQIRREYLSQLSFPSEIVCAVAARSPNLTTHEQI